MNSKKGVCRMLKLIVGVLLLGYLLYLPLIDNSGAVCGPTGCANATPIVCAAGAQDCGIPLATPIGFGTPKP